MSEIYASCLLKERTHVNLFNWESLCQQWGVRQQEILLITLTSAGVQVSNLWFIYVTWAGSSHWKQSVNWEIDYALSFVLFLAIWKKKKKNLKEKNPETSTKRRIVKKKEIERRQVTKRFLSQTAKLECCLCWYVGTTTALGIWAERLYQG